MRHSNNTRTGTENHDACWVTCDNTVNKLYYDCDETGCAASLELGHKVLISMQTNEPHSLCYTDLKLHMG